MTVHPSSVLCSAGHPLAGFLRFLQLLGTHPWQERPLVIGSAHELLPAQRSTLANLFTAGRQAGTLPAVVLATAKDPQGTAWTQRGPSGDVWRRLVLLARRGLQALQVGSSSPTRAFGHLFRECLVLVNRLCKRLHFIYLGCTACRGAPYVSDGCAAMAGDAEN